MSAPLQRIDNPDAVKALVDPTRRAMTLELAKEHHSITELARILNKTPATIHYHMRRLLPTGLVRLVATRTINNNLVEKRYGLTTPALCVVGYSIYPPQTGPVPTRGPHKRKVIAAVDEASLRTVLQELGWAGSSLPMEEIETLLVRLTETAHSVFLQGIAAAAVSLPEDSRHQCEALAAALPTATLAALVRDEDARGNLSRLVAKLRR